VASGHFLGDFSVEGREDGGGGGRARFAFQGVGEKPLNRAGRWREVWGVCMKTQSKHGHIKPGSEYTIPRLVPYGFAEYILGRLNNYRLHGCEQRN
jgi:hypothetical protein